MCLTVLFADRLLAHRAGIDVFATGGIGGVHRGVEDSMDISADLTELGRTPVTVRRAPTIRNTTHTAPPAFHRHTTLMPYPPR